MRFYKILFISCILASVIACGDDNMDMEEVVPVWDCEELELNIGDSCIEDRAGAPMTVWGTINQECECDSLIVSTVYDCPELMLNFRDSTAIGLVGFVNPDCECEAIDADCPRLQLNIGDSCWAVRNLRGIVNENCQCEPFDMTYDCPELMLNIGDSCVTVIVQNYVKTSGITVEIEPEMSDRLMRTVSVK